MTEKLFISAQQLLDDSFRLGRAILKSGFRPTYIIGVWRGGAPIGIAVQEILDYNGVKTDHISIRTSSYDGMEQRTDEVRIHGLGYIIDNINAEDRLLIVDDTFDSGRSVGAIIDKLRALARRNTPEVIKVATIYYKPTLNKVGFAPDYYLHETDQWLVFPHEINGLSDDEIREHKPLVMLNQDD